MSGQQKYFRFEDNMICMTLDFTNNKNNHIFMNELDKYVSNTKFYLP